MQTALVALATDIALPPIELRDVDSDPDLQRRYGAKVPVLMLDGALVCFGSLDVTELRRLLDLRGRV